MMKEQRPGGQADYAEHTVECLREHALDFSADETGSGQVEVRERQHVAFDAALFLFIHRHDQQHGNERGGDRRDGAKGLRGIFRREPQKWEYQEDQSPSHERDAEQAVGQRFVVLAFAPEQEADADKNEGSGNVGGDREIIQAIRGGPQHEYDRGADSGENPKLLANIKLRAEEEANAGEAEQRVIQSNDGGGGKEPRSNTRPKIVQAIKDPAGDPEQKIGLALQRIDVGKKHSDEKSGEKQTERDDALSHVRA